VDRSTIDARRSAPLTNCSVRDSSRLHAGHELLRSRQLTLRDGLRIAPYADTLRQAFRMARSFDRSLLHTSNSAPCTNYSALDAWHSVLSTDCSAFSLLRLCVARGLLRAQHFEASLPRLDFSLPGTYRSAPETDYSVSDTYTLHARELLRAHT
jgi:hypothetical protein